MRASFGNAFARVSALEIGLAPSGAVVEPVNAVLVMIEQRGHLLRMFLPSFGEVPFVFEKVPCTSTRAGSSLGVAATLTGSAPLP
jgi:hypothetical protein